MKYGMNFLLYTGDLGTDDKYVPTLAGLKEMGYDGVEIPIFDSGEAKYAAWGKKLDELGLERTAVTIRTDDNNPISPEAPGRWNFPRRRSMPVRRFDRWRKSSFATCCNTSNGSRTARIAARYPTAAISSSRSQYRSYFSWAPKSPLQRRWLLSK
jgi:sugar phosphate isomerase/epimerase